MADEVLDKIRDVAEGTIDFDGQRRAEGLATLLLAMSGLLAFNIGFYLQDIVKALYIGLGGTAVTFLLIVPPWPFYNRNPVKWLPAGSGWQ
ncbi:hypothetical protein CDD81_2783 [Ophiocordyceps australis]|uniref:Signal peptidase complex subunit 1 n=1 Tax=Ophiocordyceps australis TaxID=1399860 RepID=A0A2C5XX17_9HYPO|nr:hypothetical protein CDD81_2783 [Ophiocordyceps australis]